MLCGIDIEWQRLDQSSQADTSCPGLRGGTANFDPRAFDQSRVIACCCRKFAGISAVFCATTAK